MLKKGYYGLIIACMLMLGVILPGGIKTEAAEDDTITEELVETEELVTPINLSNEDRIKMIELGFTEVELDTMTQEEFNKYSNLDGELTSIDNSYYKIISDSEGNILSTTEVSEKTALIQSI